MMVADGIAHDQRRIVACANLKSHMARRMPVTGYRSDVRQHLVTIVEKFHYIFDSFHPALGSDGKGRARNREVFGKTKPSFQVT